jgi:hypothetical protein
VSLTSCCFRGKVEVFACHLDVLMLAEHRRVTLMEDDVGNVHLKNLSLHHAANEEEALNLLFVVRFGSFLSHGALGRPAFSLAGTRATPTGLFRKPR